MLSRTSRHRQVRQFVPALNTTFAPWDDIRQIRSSLERKGDHLRRSCTCLTVEIDRAGSRLCLLAAPTPIPRATPKGRRDEIRLALLPTSSLRRGRRHAGHPRLFFTCGKKDVDGRVNPRIKSGDGHDEPLSHQRIRQIAQHGIEPRTEQGLRLQ